VFPAGAELVVTATNGTLNGVTLDADLLLEGNRTLFVENGLTVNGTLAVGGTGYGYLRYTGDQTFGGTGEILLDHALSYVYYGTLGSTLTIASPLLVRGFGNIGAGNGPFVNQSTIRSDVPGGSIDLDGSNGWTNEGTIEAVGGGNLSLTGSGWTNAVSGTIDVQQGVLSSGGTWSSDGTIVLGSTASMTVSGALVLGSQSQLDLAATGADPGDYPTISVTGAATLAGDLDVDFLYFPTMGDVLAFLTYASQSGTFASVEGTDPAMASVALTPSYGATSTTVTVQ
jgi:hypothetical protein